MVNRSIVDCFKNRIIICDSTALLGEIMTFAYLSYTEVIIDFIFDPDLDAGYGVLHAIIFTSLIWLNMVVRNTSANLSIRLALTIKKCMQLSLFGKTSGLRVDKFNRLIRRRLTEASQEVSQIEKLLLQIP